MFCVVRARVGVVDQPVALLVVEEQLAVRQVLEATGVQEVDLGWRS